MILRPDPLVTILPLGMAAKLVLRIRVLLLALLLGLGMSLSFVQGSVMMAEMAVAAEGAPHAPNDCDGCGRADQKDVEAGTCLPVCGAAAQGVMPGNLVVSSSISRTGLQVADLLLSGQSEAPDHGPPKTLTLS